MNENKEMNEYVVMNLSTYNEMKEQKELVSINYTEKRMKLDESESKNKELKTTLNSLLGRYLGKVALTYLINECENKEELTNPESNNFVMFKDDYCELLAMGIEKDAIIRKLKEVVANNG